MKKIVSLLTFLVITLLFFLSGCSTGRHHYSYETPRVKSVIIFGATDNNNGAVNNEVRSAAAGNDDLSYLDKRQLVFPGGTTREYRVVSGYYSANRYYAGNSNENLGSINDPMSETSQRQLYLSYGNAPPINGTYRAEFDNQSKNISVKQTDYLPTLEYEDISTGTGGVTLNVTAGDTITLQNQANPNFRYLCRIYDSLLNETTYDRYWTSKNIRNLSWLNTDQLVSFFSNLQQPDADNRVVFTIPASALTTGSENLTVIITAYDDSGIVSNTSGSFSTLTLPQTEITLTLSGI